MRPVKTYAFINARIRARIGKLLPYSFFDEIQQCHSLDEVFLKVKDTPYAFISEIYENTGDLRMVEFELNKYEITEHKEMRKQTQSPLNEFLGVLVQQYEIENIKNAIRVCFDRVIRNRSVTGPLFYLVYDPIVYPIAIHDIVNAPSFEHLVAVFTDTPYASVVKSYHKQVTNEQSLFAFEIAFDKLYYTVLFNQMKSLSNLDNKKLRRFFAVEIDLINIINLIRWHRFYAAPIQVIQQSIIPFGQLFPEHIVHAITQKDEIRTLLQKRLKNYPAVLIDPIIDKIVTSETSLELLEQLAENIIFYESRKMLEGYPFTIGIIIAYSILKRNQSSFLRKILYEQYFKQGVRN